jgi:hypothetical protein
MQDESYRRDYWRLQLLDELRARLRAIDMKALRDPTGRRRAAILDLIERYEDLDGAEGAVYRRGVDRQALTTARYRPARFRPHRLRAFLDSLLGHFHRPGGGHPSPVG